MFIDAFAVSFLINWLRYAWRDRHPSKTEWDAFERNPASHRRNADICTQHAHS